MVVKEETESKVASNLIDGKAVSAAVRARLKEAVAEEVGSGKRAPGLAVVLVGEDPASALYVQGKIKNCKQVGIESYFHKFEATASQEEVIDCVNTLNRDEKVDGILV